MRYYGVGCADKGVQLVGILSDPGLHENILSPLREHLSDQEALSHRGLLVASDQLLSRHLCISHSHNEPVWVGFHLKL